MRQEIKDVNFPKTTDNVIGIDIGYSAIKAVSENKIFKIPSYVKKIERDLRFVGEPKDTDLFYRDSEGMWAIGLSAYNLKAFDNSDTGEDILVSRSRTFSEEFRVLSNVGIGVALSTNPQKEIIIQTGLPCSYIKEDAAPLRTVLSGKREFALKIGKNDWQSFDYEIKPENVKIMEQPFGSFFSISFDKDGSFIDNSEKNILIVDGGFKTLDIAQINGAVSGKSITFDNLGMTHVYKIATDKIYQDYSADISIFAFDEALAKGVYIHRNRMTKEAVEIDVKKYYNEALKQTAQDIFDKIFNSYDGLNNIDVVVLSGGTCDACKETLTKLLTESNVNTLMSNTNDLSLELCYSNARGYYLYRRHSLGELA